MTGKSYDEMSWQERELAGAAQVARIEKRETDGTAYAKALADRDRAKAAAIFVKADAHSSGATSGEFAPGEETRTCPNCSTKVGVGTRYCGACGTDMGVVSKSSSASTSEVERLENLIHKRAVATKLKVPVAKASKADLVAAELSFLDTVEGRELYSAYQAALHRGR
jgi:hypothetical protein